MRWGWDPEVLIACCTLIDADRQQDRSDALGVRTIAEVLRARSPLPSPRRGDPDGGAVESVASQAKAEPEMLASYRFSGCTFEYPIERRSAAPSALGKPWVRTKRR